MNLPIISINNLNKKYRNHSVLNNLNWNIEQGDVVALLGKNGAGKSTLLESIMNLRNVNSGNLTIWEKKWDDLEQSKRDKIAFVAQDIGGFEWMRVKSFLSYLGSFFPSWDQQYSDKLCTKWNLDPHKKIADLSGGQSQILHVIQALSVRPELLILDEPVAHLDPSMRRQFISELIELSYKSKTTVIFSSHIISDLERISNKVALLKNGSINNYYDLETLKYHIGHIKISSDAPVQQSPYYAELSHWQEHENGATATINKPLSQDLKHFLNNAPHEIEHTPITMEDWYLEVNNEIL